MFHVQRTCWLLAASHGSVQFGKRPTGGRHRCLGRSFVMMTWHGMVLKGTTWSEKIMKKEVHLLKDFPKWRAQTRTSVSMINIDQPQFLVQQQKIGCSSLLGPRTFTSSFPHVPPFLRSWSRLRTLVGVPQGLMIQQSQVGPLVPHLAPTPRRRGAAWRPIVGVGWESRGRHGEVRKGA